MLDFSGDFVEVFGESKAYICVAVNQETFLFGLFAQRQATAFVSDGADKF
jgi:hypothetical protein